jgi:hypothetical protein
MIKFLIQNSLVHLNPLGAPKRIWCLGCSTLWRLHEGLYHFLHKMTFFKVIPKVHGYLVYATQLANLYVAQSTLTFTTPSTSHKSNSGMHCYIDGVAYESIT